MNRKDEYKEITVRVANQPNLDVAIIKAVLAALGLTSEGLIRDFGIKYNYGDFLNYCLQLINVSNAGAVWYAEMVKKARINGSVVATVPVQIELIKLIQSFLTLTNAANRISDASHQINSGIAETRDGLVKGIKESGNDLAQGFGKAASGVFDTLTAPVGSSKFKDGAKDFAEGVFRFGKGYGKFYIQTPTDATLMFGGRLISGIQVLTFMEQPGRPLTGAEIGILTPIFGNSVVYGAVRIKEGFSLALTFGPDGDGKGGTTYINNRRALTHGNTIYMKYKIPGSPEWDSTLVHETVHVWQNQNGGTDYMSEAIHAQLTVGYDYGDDIFNKKKTWYLLNPEQQGQLIQDAYDNGYFKNGGWSNIKMILDNFNNQIPTSFLINYMNQVMPQVKAGQGAT